MMSYIKHILLLCTYLLAGYTGYTNVIDSLSTKADVQKFLVANLSKNGIIYPDRCEPITWAEKEKIYYSQHPPRFDTVFMYHDPTTGMTETRVVAHDTEAHTLDSETYDYSFAEVAEAMDTCWHIYKEDIDGNGRTDIVIDAGIVLIVMDMGDHFEGHVFGGMPSWYFRTWNSYSFKNFTLLPDGTCALLLRHDHNRCESVHHTNLNKNVTYVTTKFDDNTENTFPAKIDTLYKITSGYDTVRQRIDYSDSFRLNVYPFADTVDMRLYNMTDTIVYKFGGFTDYKPGFRPGAISKIDYCYMLQVHAISTMDAGFSCFEVNKNGRCFLKYPDYSQCLGAVLDSGRLQNLWNFVSYIDIKSAKDFYPCEHQFGGVGGVFTVYFDDGTVKKIQVWSYRLPRALGYLSKSLSEISYTLKWQPCDKPQDFECSYKFSAYSSFDQAEQDRNMYECKCNY